MEQDQLSLNDAIQRKELLETIYQYIVESYNEALAFGDPESIVLLRESSNRIGEQLNTLNSRIKYLEKTDSKKR